MSTSDLARPRRVRVLIALALAVVVGVGLTGCRVQSGTAVFVSGTRISTDEVERTLDEVPDQVIDQLQNKFGSARQEIVRAYVMREIARRVCDERHIRVPGQDFQSLAKQIGVSADSNLVRVLAESSGYLNALAGSLSPQQPSPADLHEVFDSLVDAGAVPPGTPFAQVQSQLDIPALRNAVALRKVLRDAVKKYDVEVNPRYRVAAYPVPVSYGQVSGAVTVPLGDAADSFVRTPDNDKPSTGPGAGANTGP